MPKFSASASSRRFSGFGRQFAVTRTKSGSRSVIRGWSLSTASTVAWSFWLTAAISTPWEASCLTAS